jgi:hypothetical protein
LLSQGAGTLTYQNEKLEKIKPLTMAKVEASLPLLAKEGY